MKKMKFSCACKVTLGVMLAIVTLLPATALAQTIEDGEAFYVYRNDGDFNGFFYDEILDMRYSKLDYEGVEHEEYVMQEIETADSLYRIPLMAIDSISFVQPKIEYNPTVRITEELGISQYIISVSEHVINKNINYNYDVYFDGTKMPRDLMPKVGDILVNTTWKNDYIWDDLQGFAFKVTRVEDYGETIIVWGVELNSLSDIFKNFVSTERVILGEDGKPVARRMAGLRTIGMTEGDVSLNLLNLNGTFTREFPFDSKGTCNLSMTVDYGVRVGLQATYDITVDHIFVKIAMEEDITAQAGFAVSVAPSSKVQWAPDFSILPDWIGAIKFPACLPIFETQPLPKAFFRIGGAAVLKSTLPSINFKAKQLCIISDRTGSWLNCKASSNMTSGYGNDDDKLIQPGDSKLTFNAFVQAGIKFDNTIKTNSWAKKFFHSAIGLETYVGPKLSADLDISLPSLAGEIGAGSSHLLYSALRNSSVTFSPCTADVEAKAEVEFPGYPKEEVKFWEGSFSIKDYTRKFVAEMKDFSITQDDKFSTVKFNMSWGGERVLFAHDIGIAIYKYDSNNYYDRTGVGIGEEVERNMRFFLRNDGDMEYEPKLEPGTYAVIPKISLFKHDVDIDIFQNEDRTLIYCIKAFDILPELETSVTEIEVPAYGKTEEDPVTASFSYSLTAPAQITLASYGDVAAVAHDEKKQTIELTINPNTHSSSREQGISLKWNNPNSPLAATSYCHKSVKIKQRSKSEEDKLRGI